MASRESEPCLPQERSVADSPAARHRRGAEAAVRIRVVGARSVLFCYGLLPSHASRLLRPLFRDEESMAKRRFLTVAAVSATASALLGGVPTVADAVTAGQAGITSVSGGPASA